MTTWKEKGEVPDSDDSDASENLTDGGRGSNWHNAQEDTKNRHITLLDTKHGLQDTFYPPLPALAPFTSQYSESRTGSRISRKRALGLKPRLELSEKDSVESLEEHRCVEDEISKSYVSLSSPLSSLSSSAFLNLEEGLAKFRNIETHSLPDSNDDWAEEIQPNEGLLQGAKDGDQGHAPRAPTERSRSLRERNPIQIHPFLIEEERYRRTLKARNIKPLRLANVQANRKVDSPDPDFEPQDESQNANLEQIPQILVPDEQTDSLIGSGLSNSFLTGKADNDDDEFPEIEELLKRRHDSFINSSQVTRKLPRTFQSASSLPSKRFEPESSTQMHPRKARDLFEVPPSPPRTSSPLPTFLGYRSLRHAISTSASSRTASPEHVSSQQDERLESPPTPTTDTVKHTADKPTEGTENNPVALESESEMSLSSDSDSQIRRIGKKIRGVLPASWIRLDRKFRFSKKPNEAHRNRRFHSLSPPIVSLRRGVAVPKDVGILMSHQRNSQPRPYTIPDETEGSDSSGFPDFAEEIHELSDTHSISSNENTSSVIEEDQIDAMLQSRKRQASSLSEGGRRKIRRLATSAIGYSRSQQSKITQHLVNPQNSGTTSGRVRRYKSHKKRLMLSKKIEITGSNFLSRLYSPPRLSILDVPLEVDNRYSNPLFIRIAARNARSRANFGRQSPTRKFIRLSNREDTSDAQSTLQKWREGTISPMVDLEAQKRIPHIFNFPPSSLLDKKGIGQNTGRKSSVVSTGRNNVSREGYRRKPEQTRINWQAQPRSQSAVNVVEGRLLVDNRSNSNPVRKPTGSSRRMASFRPAQLETSGTEYNGRHPNLVFRSTKRTLDALYRKSLAGIGHRQDNPMSRFLTDEKPGTPGVAIGSSTEISSLENCSELSMEKTLVVDTRRRQKRAPKRIDAGAAKYQQPSNPLILDYLQSATATQEVDGANGKLIGLGSVGTRYTYHFNIFPLQLGVYFHESTVLGSGLFSQIIDSPAPSIGNKFNTSTFHRRRGYKYFELSEKALRWGPWDETVSSELGVCFDWITEQLDTIISTNSSQDMGITRCLIFIVEYVRQSLDFPSEACYRGCIFRFIEVLDTFADHIQQLSLNMKPGISTYEKTVIEASTLGIVLVFQVIQLSRPEVSMIKATSQLEALLRRISTLTVRLLLLIGLECIRDLYDDLQYLAFREGGIKSDRYSAQSWIIIMHVLQLAQIPRHSFWDMVNSELISEHMISTNDARIFERVWYAMFSLLPLVEFDKLGVLTPGLRQTRLYENWALPQRIAKRIFELYASRSKQSPSFNEYCRALFSRCFHLIQVWGWRRQNAIIGTLFDFFASHKLSHLRNEDAYRSPRFLEQLNSEPSLAVEPEDRCFHILLKIIATAIKQLRIAEDMRGVRNLIARVLPNHDRQYPKEESVTQRDLASLRNNHDLLCTLFWAAPQRLRPQINLIRELVNPERSHKEAYLINLEAWRNLAQFILSSEEELSTFQPLREWQAESFGSLLGQYLSVENDMEQQLAQLSDGARRLISQSTINKTLEKNREHIRMALTLQMRDISQLMSQVRTMDCIDLLFDERQLSMYLSLVLCKIDLEQEKTDEGLGIVYTYLEELHKRIPLNSTQIEPTPVEEDSQTYGSESGFAELANPRSKYIEGLIPRVFDAVRKVVHQTLHSNLRYSLVQFKISTEAIRVWAFLAATLISGGFHDLSDYFGSHGKYAEATLDSESLAARNFTGQFLVQVLGFGRNLTLKDLRRDPLGDFLCFLVLPGNSIQDLDTLLIHYAECEPILALKSKTDPIFPSNSEYEYSVSNVQRYDENDSATRRLALADDIFDNMQKTLRDNNVSRKFYPDQTSSDVTRRLQDIVNCVSDLITSLNRHVDDEFPEFKTILIKIRLLMDSRILPYLQPST